MKATTKIEQQQAISMAIDNAERISKLCGGLDSIQSQELMKNLLDPASTTRESKATPQQDKARSYLLPSEEGYWSATELGDIWGVSNRMIGILSTQHGLKEAAYGNKRYYETEKGNLAQAWKYNQNGRERLAVLLKELKGIEVKA